MITCKKCRGMGEHLKADGYTKADIIKCAICSGTGIRPADMKFAKYVKNMKNRHIKRHEGMEDLHLVVAE